MINTLQSVALCVTVIMIVLFIYAESIIHAYYEAKQKILQDEHEHQATMGGLKIEEEGLYYRSTSEFERVSAKNLEHGLLTTYTSTPAPYRVEAEEDAEQIEEEGEDEQRSIA